MRGPARELVDAIARLEAVARRRETPHHHDARAVLIPLGELLLEGAEGVDATVARIEEITSPWREEWARAVDAELQLACAEHCQSVDPRHLDHPRYDFEYTIAARERLEARLAAADALGLSAPEELVTRLVQADAVLEPYLREREGGAPPN